jgi:hypothetical protein
MKFLLKILPFKFKIWILDVLYQDIAGKGTCGDTELAHINKDEAKLLKLAGGSGTVNECTGLKQYGKGGGGSAPAPAPAAPANTTQTTYAREAPDIESRKLALYDEAIELSKVPIGVPSYQVAGASPLEQQGFGIAQTTGVGLPALQEGLGALQQAGAQALQGPDIDAFFNPYERYTIDEINRQAAMKEQAIASQAIGAGAFGGGREGIQRAEQERARLSQIGQLRGQGFQAALGAAQQQQAFQQQALLNQAKGLSDMATQQQQMQQRDIQSQLQAGAIQRDIAQRALTAERQTEVARAYEPFQRIEFQKGIMTALPTAASQVTAGTGPGVNPFAQAVGAGVGAYKAFDILGGTGITGGKG